MHKPFILCYVIILEKFGLHPLGIVKKQKKQTYSSPEGHRDSIFNLGLFHLKFQQHF